MVISVCWIAKNEEKHIARSINSLKDYVEEMIVVDTGSTDRTAEIAAELGAKVIRFEWDDDFSAARNFAVSFARGDVVMCPDADMWYDPPLGQKERDMIEKAFKNPHVDGVTGIILDVDVDRGIALNEAVFTLAFRRGAVSYHNPIHEQLLRADGSFMDVVHLPIKVRHSGYSASVSREKAARNLALLKRAVMLEDGRGGRRKAILDFYLMRENLNCGDYGAAFDSYSALRANPSTVKELVPYKAITSTYFFIGMGLAAFMRFKVSRADIYENLVKVLRRTLPGHAVGDMLELTYQKDFDLKEDVFLEEMEKRAKLFDPRLIEFNSDATKAFGVLCAKSALICRRRGEAEKAFDWCVNRVRVSEVFDSEVFSILLSCVRGQPEPEIIMFLSGLFPSDAPTQAHALAEGLIQDGFQTAFKYFVMKQVEGGLALDKHFLQLLILNGNYAEAVNRAVEMKESLSDDTFSEILFMASLCSGEPLDPELKACLNAAYAALYQAMEMKADIPGNSDEREEGAPDGRERNQDADRGDVLAADAYDAAFINRIFNQLVFFSGLSDAYNFLMLFSRNPQVCFFVESKYFFDNALYDNVLFSKFAAGLKDEASQEVLLLARILGGRHVEAFAQIKEALGAWRISSNLLNHLLTLADKAVPDIAEEARALYARHSYLYDEFIDYDDVVRTKLVFDRHGKQDRKVFKEMSLDAFRRFVASDIYPTDHLTHLMTIAQAARIYEEKGLDTMALRCFIRLYACAYKEDETLYEICRILKKLGNIKLATALERME
jgi:glycosyltransferase involved in cell wall biosynthesis